MDYDKSWRPRNFRDVGESYTNVSNIDLLHTGKVFRGGEFDVLFLAAQHECIGNPKTILNVRAQADKEDTFKEVTVKYIHFPTKNGPKEYHTTQKDIRIWVRSVVQFLCSLKEDDYPLYIHCRSGKDRTGIVVAILLLILGADPENVVKEYMESKEGKVSENQIRMAIEPYNSQTKIQKEFKKSNINQLKEILLKK